MELLTELWHLLRTRKRYWMIPVFVALGIAAVIFYAYATVGATAIVYPLF